VAAVVGTADVAVADLGAAAVAEVADVQAGELVDAGVGLVEQAQDVQQILGNQLEPAVSRA
jgi:hypothetical protein